MLSLMASATRRLRVAAVQRSAAVPTRRFASFSNLPSGTLFASEGVMHVAGGAAFFVVAEKGTAYALESCGLKLPSSVTALCLLGTGVALLPLSSGAVLQRTLGPATAWMRAALPLLLTPAFLFPAIATLPEAEALPKLALLAAGGVLITCAASGHLAAVLVRGVMPAVPVACEYSIGAANALFSSVTFGAAALVIGLAVSRAALLTRDTLDPTITGHLSDARARAPAYLGLTVALYTAAARVLPPSVRKFCPPNVGCALLLLPLLLLAGGGGASEVRTYLDGAGAALLACVQPCMVTLFLYVHTHRAVILQQRACLLTLGVVVAPLSLFGMAYAGRTLGVAPVHVASLLPASTTTGLALTMPSGMPLIEEGLVAAGTAFNSGVAQVTLPLLLAATRLSSPFGRGVGVGCTAHVGGMAALVAAGEIAAADACAVALVIVGVARSVLVQVPPVSRALERACGEEDRGGCPS